MKWHTEKRKISDLIFTKYNPQTQTKKQKADLSKSIEKFDLVEIPAINTDGQVLAGHKRLAELIESGRQDEIIDVRVPDETLSKKLCDEYLIRSNKNHGEWDFEKLNKEFELPDLKDWGFEEKELVGSVLEDLRKIEGVEIEQSAN